LGQLIHNPELYQNLNRTIRNVEYLTRKLEPIIDDARVFSDKVSRNPGIIVRDAVRPGPGLK
jgi:phospholipid/cholesterol/gamma-HCH transport system substrate-binding protein